MLFVVLRNENTCKVDFAFYDDYPTYYRCTFNPCYRICYFMDLDSPISGDTYQIKKGRLREKAIDFQLVIGECEHDLSWAELSAITQTFEKYGRKYGLLKEFRENGICWKEINYDKI